MSNDCPESVQLIIVSGGMVATTNEIQAMSTVCPCWMFVQSLSNEPVAGGGSGATTNSIGQYLDKYWIFKSNLCPRKLLLDRDVTDS